MRLANPSTSLSDILECLVDEHVGIIRSVKEVRTQARDPKFFHFQAQACDTSFFYGRRNFGRAGGASSDRGLAMAKAIGEAVERYCSACFFSDELPFSSYDDAPFPCVAPKDFVLYREEQYTEHGFPYVRFCNSTPVRWTAARDLTSGCVSYVPAAMVFLPYHYEAENGEFPIAQPISTGLACHGNFAEAVISAVCEVIERDAVMIAWQAQLSLTQINATSLTEANRDLVARFEGPGRTLTLFDIAMDVGIPTVFSVLREADADSPALVVAASADLDPEQAVRKSLEELAHTRQFARHLKTTVRSVEPGLDYRNVVHQDDHIRFYCDRENGHLADFLFSSNERINFRDIKNFASRDPLKDLDLLLEKVSNTNHHVLVADITTSDVADLGLTVVRAIIPGFHPLFMGHPYRALGGERLWNIPTRLGYRGIVPASGDNPAPHPYP